MPEEKKPSRPEISFLPPLKMILAFFDREARKLILKKDDTRPVDTKEDDVRRIIDRLNDTDKKSD
jgi:hypothetical protein